MTAIRTLLQPTRT